MIPLLHNVANSDDRIRHYRQSLNEKSLIIKILKTFILPKTNTYKKKKSKCIYQCVNSWNVSDQEHLKCTEPPSTPKY